MAMASVQSSGFMDLLSFFSADSTCSVADFWLQRIPVASQYVPNFKLESVVYVVDYEFEEHWSTRSEISGHADTLATDPAGRSVHSTPQAFNPGIFPVRQPGQHWTIIASSNGKHRRRLPPAQQEWDW